MKINQDLIEKYQRGECSTAECRLVEEWLFAEDFTEELELPITEHKADHKTSIWEGIQAVLPADLPAQKTPVLMFWKGAIAASLFIGLMGIAIYHLVYRADNLSSQVLSVDNTETLHVRHMDSDEGDIAVGPNTLAKINYKEGTADLSGSMLISPKKDMQLIFKGSQEKISLKSGQTYIILNSKTGTDKMIVVTERNLMDLPPVLQKQIINQFSI